MLLPIPDFRPDRVAQLLFFRQDAKNGADAANWFSRFALAQHGPDWSRPFRSPVPEPVGQAGRGCGGGCASWRLHRFAAVSVLSVLFISFGVMESARASEILFQRFEACDVIGRTSIFFFDVGNRIVSKITERDGALASRR